MAAELIVVDDDRTRPALSRDVIADAAMRLTLDQPRTPLTLARLGTELGADPTAIYRHFRNRDELLLELVDRVFHEAHVGFGPTDEWRASLTTLAWRLRDALLRRPALAAEAAWRFTGGPNERVGVESAHAIFCRAGFDPEEALLNVRAFFEVALSHVVMTASGLTHGDDSDEADMTVAERLYGPSVRDSSYDYDATTFALILRIQFAGIETLLARSARAHDDTTKPGGPT